MSHRRLRGTVAASVVPALAMAGGVLVEPSYSEDGRKPMVPAPDSYARFPGVEIDSPDENFFSTIKLEDLPEEFEKSEEARLFRYRLEPGSKDHYVVVTEGSKTANTPFGKQVVNHRMEVLLDHSVESVERGVASVRQTVHDFYVCGRRKLPSPGGSARDILIRKRWFGDVIKVWSGTDLLADNKGTTNDPQGAKVVQHLTREIVRMTRDITFLAGTDGRTTEVKGPAEFVALFQNDFGSPFGLVLPEEKMKPGTSFTGWRSPLSPRSRCPASARTISSRSPSRRSSRSPTPPYSRPALLRGAQARHLGPYSPSDPQRAR